MYRNRYNVVCLERKDVNFVIFYIKSFNTLDLANNDYNNQIKTYKNSERLISIQIRNKNGKIIKKYDTSDLVYKKK